MSKAIVNTSNTNIISKQVTEYANQFKVQAKKTAEGVLEMARVVFDAKQLGTADFEVFCSEVGYKSDSSTIRKLKSIGEKYQFLLSRSKSLPTSWTTLYQVSRLTTEVIDEKINEGVITPNLDGKGLAVRLGLSEPSAPKAVPNGTENALTFSVDLELIPTAQDKVKLRYFIAELENAMKAKVKKSASLEAFLNDSQVELAKAA
jgi:hypothetical protein